MFFSAHGKQVLSDSYILQLIAKSIHGMGLQHPSMKVAEEGGKILLKAGVVHGVLPPILFFC